MSQRKRQIPELEINESTSSSEIQRKRSKSRPKNLNIENRQDQIQNEQINEYEQLNAYDHDYFGNNIEQININDEYLQSTSSSVSHDHSYNLFNNFPILPPIPLEFDQSLTQTNNMVQNFDINEENSQQNRQSRFRVQKFRQNLNENQRQSQRENARIGMQNFRANLDENERMAYQNRNANYMTDYRDFSNEKKAKTYLWAKDPSKAEFYSLSDFSLKCKHCKAPHFAEEVPASKKDMEDFNDCCKNGSLLCLENSIEPYPDEFRSLYDPTNKNHKIFIEKIRHINSLFSFASLSCFKFNFEKGRGPPVFKVQGQLYHRFNTVAQPISEIPSNGQLYFIDPDDALKHRQNQTAFKNGINQTEVIDEEILNKIDNVLREINIFADGYKYMREISQEQEEISKLIGGESPEVKLLFSVREGYDKRRYNLPVVNDVFGIVVCDSNGDIPPAQIVIALKGEKNLINLFPLDPIVEPMLYPILFPRGTYGWDYKIKDATGKKITQCDFVKFRLFYREETEKIFFPLHYSKKLFQQWIVDMYAKIEWERLMFIKRFQKQIVKTNYTKVNEYLAKKAASSNVDLQSQVCILPSSFSGGPRNLHEHFMDSMAIVNKKGKPDLFITYTINPNDNDIKKCLLKGQSAHDRPDIITRVFNLKKDKLIEEIVKGQIFGKIISYVWSVEFQKRGLPHLHLLVTLDPKDKWRNKNDIDSFISAQLPDPANKVLYEIVSKSMVHGPCNSASACWNHLKKKCDKKFPFPFREETEINENGYPHYKRPNNGRYVYRNGVRLTNQNVVPYNPYLSLRFNSHINVEKVADIKAVKYLYKYILKGYDKAIIECVTNDQNGTKKFLKYDEVGNYLDARCISPCEAAWRIFKYPLQGKSHHVMALPVHLEGEQSIYLDPEADEETMQTKAEKHSPLIGYFKYMEQNPEKNYLYGQMPEFCTWNSKKGIWTERKTHKNTIGRIYPVNPRETEKYYLYYLLLNVSGKSYKDLKIVDGIEYPTFGQAALARGLCKNDDEWKDCLSEAKKYRFPRALRTLFSNILIHCNPAFPELLWDLFKNDLSLDIKRRFPSLPDINIYQKTLSLIDQNLKYQDKSLTDFKTMPQLNHSFDDIDDDDLYDPGEEIHSGLSMVQKMNKGQQEIIEELRKTIESETNHQSLIFIDGPGGTGKSYVLTALYHLARGNRKCVTNVAYSGIAATNLKKGRTLHNRFKFPLNVKHNSTSAIDSIGKEAEEIKKISIIIWDEAPMAPKHMLNIIDKKLKELMKNNKLFGGKTLILSGDFRQCLPVQENSTRTEIVDLLIKNSHLWKNFKIMHLTENMRAGLNENEFAKNLIEIGNGGSDFVEVPKECICKGNLIDEIYGDIIENQDYSQLSDRAILSPYNSIIDKYNADMMEIFPGECESFLSIDETDVELNKNFPVSLEILNSLKSPGFPDHKLKIKRNSVIMLLRNLDIKAGLCNGTRLQVLDFQKNILCCAIMNGDRKGETCFIPRISLIEDKKFPIFLRRHQFPVKTAFGITINKSQSQTFSRIGIDYSEDPFSHGQTYVALSRARSWKGIKIKVSDDTDNKIKNIVWQEVLN